MQKISKSMVPHHPACTAQQVYMLGTFNPDETPLLLSQVSVCFIQGPPEGIVVGIMSSEQPKTAENIIREQVFSLNYCNTAMRGLAERAWYERVADKNDESASFCRGSALNVPVLDVSPLALECSVQQSFKMGRLFSYPRSPVSMRAAGLYALIRKLEIITAGTNRRMRKL